VSPLTFAQRRAVLSIVHFQLDHGPGTLAHAFKLAVCFPCLHNLRADLFARAFCDADHQLRYLLTP
jgi:hypothetical protein